MLKVKLTSFKHESKVIEFECITHEIEKGYYKFYISSTEIKYFPMYDFICDIVYPFELEIK